MDNQYYQANKQPAKQPTGETVSVAALLVSLATLAIVTLLNL